MLVTHTIDILLDAPAPPPPTPVQHYRKLAYSADHQPQNKQCQAEMALSYRVLKHRQDEGNPITRYFADNGIREPNPLRKLREVNRDGRSTARGREGRGKESKNDFWNLENSSKTVRVAVWLVL